MFKTVESNEEADITEKKSKFIANIFYITSEEEAEEKIRQIKRKHNTARHHCYAYRIIRKNEIINKSSDDGEPSGTAGMPMLNILEKNNFIKESEIWNFCIEWRTLENDSK
jgi:putative IMPACT (imprinted ancient) family translation regulator